VHLPSAAHHDNCRQSSIQPAAWCLRAGSGDCRPDERSARQAINVPSAQRRSEPV